MTHPRERYREYLERLRADVASEDLKDYFTNDWFVRLEGYIDAWDGKSTFKLDENTFFISYLGLVDPSTLVREVREVLDLLSDASPKASVVRGRIRALTGDTANAVGGLFELRALVPLIKHPNSLIELQPKIGSSEKRAEALVEVAGQVIYVEATIFTRQDASWNRQGAFSYDLWEQLRIEGSALRNKILEKAEQTIGAEKPVVLFVAEGMVTTGLTIDHDPRAWALADVVRHGGAPSISAVIFAKDAYCSKAVFYRNESARNPLDENAISWFGSQCANGWLA